MPGTMLRPEAMLSPIDPDTKSLVIVPFYR